jgi:hypothetical protein
MRALCGKFTVLASCAQYSRLLRRRDYHQMNKLFSLSSDMLETESK